MNRDEFLRKVMQILLIGFLAFLAVISGRKVAAGTDCSSCPGKGICAGESDCSIFLSE